LLVRAVGALPWQRGQRFGAWLGERFASHDTRATRVTATNLARCFPTMPAAERDALVRASLRETGKLICETASLWSGGARRWEQHVRAIHGIELIDAARTSRMGVLVLAPHFGNWELLNCLLGARYQATVMYEPLRNRRLDAQLIRARAMTGSVPAPSTMAGLRQMLRTLDAAGVVGLLPDQVPTRESGVHAPFFGVPALTMTLPQRLLCRAKATPLLAAATRNPDGTFDVAFEPVTEAARSADPVSAATALNAAIEALVRRHPAQYQWEYKRFKRPPVGERSPYR
jgi:KDO2-lipid IV(A) lauroyltransferase